MTLIEFEDILKDVGGFGHYQKTLVLLTMPAFVAMPWFFMNMIFMTSTPDHWCYVKDVADSNLSLEAQMQLIRPPTDSSCSMYDVNYSQILKFGNFTVDSNWPTKRCNDGWQFDKSVFSATAATKWNMVCSDAHFSSVVLSLTFVGNLCGAPVFSFLSDKIGRKPIFLLLAALVSLTEISSVLIPNFALFLVLRAINGSAMATIYGCLYILLLELVDPEIRTRINGLSTTCWTTGLCLLSLIAWSTRHWIYISIVSSTSAASLLLYWILLPESPRWLIARERYDEAHSILSKISKMNGSTIHEENQLMLKIQKLGEKIKKQKIMLDKDSPLDLLKYPTLRKRFLLVTICWIGNSIPYYGLQMNVRNLSGNEFLNFLLMSLVEVPSHLGGWYCMQRLGRRWCSVFAFIGSTVACLMPAVLPADYVNVGVVSSLFAKASTSIAFMTVYQQCPELMPTSLRGVGMGLSSTIGTGSALLAPYVIYLGKYGSYIPFLIFSVIAFFSAICASFLPETLNKNLPQTVTDAENFEKNFKFFSCSRNKPEAESEMHLSNWAPATLSVADLTSSVKNTAAEDTTKYIQALAQRNFKPIKPKLESNVDV